jgi:hypothetical protein
MSRFSRASSARERERIAAPSMRHSPLAPLRG